MESLLLGMVKQKWKYHDVNTHYHFLAPAADRQGYRVFLSVKNTRILLLNLYAGWMNNNFDFLISRDF